MFFKYSASFYLFWFLTICRRIRNLVYFSSIKLIYGPALEPPTDQEKIEAYHEKQKQHLLSRTRPSSNVDRLFYDKAQYASLSWKEMDTLKGRWKQRVLLEPLPIHPSSIVMFYNPEKFAFSYYSDTVISSYTLLNAVAMKYTTLFFCQDFFVDEAITQQSPLLSILRDEFMFDPRTTTKETSTIAGPEDNDETLQFIQDNNTLFKKLKVNVKASSNRTAREVKQDTAAQQQEKENAGEFQCKNRFIYLGRVRDFCPLKKQLSLKNAGKMNLFPEMTDHAEPTETDKSVFMGSSMGWKNFKEKKMRERKEKNQQEWEDGLLI